MIRSPTYLTSFVLIPCILFGLVFLDHSKGAIAFHSAVVVCPPNYLLSGKGRPPRALLLTPTGTGRGVAIVSRTNLYRNRNRVYNSGQNDETNRSEERKDRIAEYGKEDSIRREINDYYDPTSKVEPLPEGLTAQQVMNALGTNPRRIFLSLTSATGVALAGNLLGITSSLLNMFPEQQVEKTGLDTYFPRGDYKRVNTPLYSFVIPKEWVADTSLALAKANARAQPLDYRMGAGSSKRVTLPDSAFGPPGGTRIGNTNVSVIISTVPSGFSIKSLGTPQDAAQNLAAKSIAPEGSGRVATVVSATEDTDRGVYQFLFNIDFLSSQKSSQNLSVIACRGNELITLTIVAPTETWVPPFSDKMNKIASSFHIK